VTCCHRRDRFVNGSDRLGGTGSQIESASESELSRLTPKQRQALLAAYSLGYYDVPRRTSSELLAKRLKLGASTVAEHLRKAERNLLSRVLAA
jgi:predicted DNA binding protein